MSFLNPWLLLGVLGISLPILAHMLNRHQVKTTDWAAMRFLNRSVRVRSRQLRLRDLLLLIMRCAAVVCLILALARPSTGSAGGGDPLGGAIGEQRAGVVIAIDASLSMQHRDGPGTRFEKAIEQADAIAQQIRPGDPVTLVLLAAGHRAVVRNAAFDPDTFAERLLDQSPTAESLDLDSVPRLLTALAKEIKAPQKEVYLITDVQEQDWNPRSAWLAGAMKELAAEASVFIVPVGSGAENLAITELELVHGVLRKGTLARYRATVTNFGDNAAQNVRVTGQLNSIHVDTAMVPVIAPGGAETVSLAVPFRDAGPVRITAVLDDDALSVDNARRAVAVIREQVSVLCVDGASGGDRSGDLIAEALRAHGSEEGKAAIDVQTVSWVDLPSRNVNEFDVVILADVPDIAAEQAQALEAYVREGRGLIWFGGDNVKADVWNKRSARDGTPLLPAVLESAQRSSDAAGIGRPLDPSLTDHAVCRPLMSLSEDLLSETRFRKLLRVQPHATSATVLTLAGQDAPVLLEHSLGRGQVFMFTTSAGPSWNNMAVTPVLPMLLQQMVTYLTAREFETPRTVADSLSLSYVDEPDATDAVFETPSGETLTVPVRDYRNRYVAVLDNAREPGFYTARVSLQATGVPIAVNAAPRESQVKPLSADALTQALNGTGVRVVRSKGELQDGIASARTARSWWRVFMIAAISLLVVESLFADWSSRSTRSAGQPAEATH